MAGNIIDIIIRMRKEGGAVENTQGNLAQLGKTLAVVSAAVVAFGVAAKKAFDLAQEGAVVVQTAESFDLLIDKVGAVPDLLDRLTVASGGTISQLQLQSSTATLLAGASGELATQLANSTPQLLEIARAANKLNPSLGTTDFLYQSLATGIKRASPLILDNLGLTIKVGEANEKYAEQLGKSVEQLTAEEQKQALLNDVLRAGGVLIDQVGGSLDSATDSYSRLGAATADATDRFKGQLHEALEPLIGALADGLESQNLLHRAAEAGLVTWDRNAQKYRDAAGELMSIGEAAQYVKDNLDELGHLEAMNELLAQMEEVSSNDVWDEIEAGAVGSGDAISDLVDGTGEVGDAFNDAEDDAVDFFSTVDTSIGNTISGFIDKLTFAIAGGVEYSRISDQIRDALNDPNNAISPETALAFYDELFVQEQAFEVSIGNISFDEAAKNLQDTLGVELGEANGLLQDVLDKGAEINGARWNASIEIAVIANRPGWLAEAQRLQGLANFYQSNGRAEGGPVSAGRAYRVGERGPELFAPPSDGRIISNADLRDMGNSSAASVRIDLSRLEGEVAGLRVDLRQYQETMPIMMAAQAEKGIR